MPPPNAPYIVSVGQHKVWVKNNWQWTAKRDLLGMSPIGSPQLTTSVIAGKYLVTKSVGKKKDWGVAHAQTGVKFHLKGVNTEAQWNAIRIRRCASP